MKHPVRIRPITEADTDKIIAWRNAPSVMEHFIYRTPLTRDDHLNWFHNRVQTGEVAQFMIIDEEMEQEVGSVYLRDIDRQNQKCEYGIFIGEDSCRGKGIGSAAARLALDYAFGELKLNRVFLAARLALGYAFETLGLNRVFLRVFAENLRAQKSYENAGFRYEGTFRDDVIIDGEAHDMVFMGILRRDWKKEG